MEIQEILSLKSLPNEEWKDVKDFNGIYKISNFGRLLSLKSNTPIILSNKNKKGGYLSVVLNYKNITRHTRIHRLVYETFIEEIPKGKKHHIHHKDGNKQNNNISNLELVTSKEHHLIHVKENPSLYRNMNYYNKYIRPKKIHQFSLEGKYIATYNNSKEASDATNVCQRNILQVANKEPYNKKGSIRKQAGGYIWKIEK